MPGDVGTFPAADEQSSSLVVLILRQAKLSHRIYFEVYIYIYMNISICEVLHDNTL